MSLRTPLSQARGLGSAREGALHFWRQRVTGGVNLVLIGFVFYAAIRLAGADYAGVKAFFANPLSAVLVIMFAGSAAYHMQLGMQVVIEDYIHKSGNKTLLLFLNQFFAILVGLVCVFSVIKLSFQSFGA
jgi:succinate dehydrogenase / fumarate reductase membrane anchor subunit